MKILKNIILIFTLSLFIWSCEDNDNLTILNTDASVEVSLSTNVVILLQDNEDQDVLNVSWNEPNFGFDASASYEVLLDLSSGDFTEAQTLTVDAGSLSKIFQNKELNSHLLNLGVEPDTETEIKLIVKAILGPNTNVISLPQTLTVTAFSGVLDLSSEWGVVGSATTNGWDGPDLPFYKTQNENEFVAYVNLVDGEIKIRANNAWDVNYGDAQLDGILDTDNDNNISVTAGSYKILFNSVTLAYSIENFSWGLVGSATTNGWDGPDLNLEYDPYSDQWRALVTLADGELKIRANNSWDTNYGDAQTDGILDTDNDNNILVTAGNYLVTVNFNDLSYSIVETDIWGLVGSATPNGWDGPDTKFSLDFSKENFWVLNGINLIDGEIKVRANDSWDVNYGDFELDGILDQENDNNIAVTAGTYDLTLDFTDPNNPIYTIN